jgi:hypothetical protein
LKYSSQNINQVIHILYDLNASPQDLLRLTKTASRLIKRHLLLDKAFVLFILRESAIRRGNIKQNLLFLVMPRVPAYTPAYERLGTPRSSGAPSVSLG